MGKSSFDYREDSTPSGGSSSPWTAALSVGKNLFDYYDSRGNATISVATEIDNGADDGPIFVARYDTLTLNAILTPKYRPRGLVILCDTLVAGASGGISMDGKGSVGAPSWPSYNLSIPDSVSVVAKYIRKKDYLATLRSRGWFVGDPVLAAIGHPDLGDALGTITEGTRLLTASGCGAGGAAVAKGAGGNATVYQTGNGGAAGSVAPGGGGSGGAYLNTTGLDDGGASGGAGGPGTPWSGGDAGLSGLSRGAVGAGGFAYGGKNARPGGVLIIICRGTANLTAGHAFSARGLAATNAGGPAGGLVAFICGGTITGMPNLVATAGAAGAYGGAGGPGATLTKTWADMGWT